MPLKDRLYSLLVEGSLEQIAGMAERKKRVLGSLVSLTYDPDPLISWRAVESMGLACDRLADGDPDCVRQHARRLYWLISEESGGICWRAPEAMGEIVHRRPKLLADYVPIVVFLLREMAEEDLEHFRSGILWAIGRLGTACADHAAEVLPAITDALSHADPQVRGTAVWCLSSLGRGNSLKDRPNLAADEGPVTFYVDRHLVHTNVANMACRAMGVATQ